VGSTPTLSSDEFGSVGNLADHSRSEREMLRVRIPPEPLWERMKDEQKKTPTRPLVIRHHFADSVICPRGAARSARHPVKVEIVGSNPIGGAG
jgi:hypothetical protein